MASCNGEFAVLVLIPTKSVGVVSVTVPEFLLHGPAGGKFQEALPAASVVRNFPAACEPSVSLKVPITSSLAVGAVLLIPILLPLSVMIELPSVVALVHLVTLLAVPPDRINMGTVAVVMAEPLLKVSVFELEVSE